MGSLPAAPYVAQPYVEVRIRTRWKTGFPGTDAFPTVTVGGMSFPPMGLDRPERRELGGRGCAQMLELYTGLTTWWADLKERISEDRGATAVEYALMVALIAVVIILAVTFLGTSASTKFSQVGSAVNQAGGGGS